MKIFILQIIKNIKELKKCISDYIHFYNFNRFHS
ncbi:IS3 family transposase, partial [Aliarcobacter butzleri]